MSDFQRPHCLNRAACAARSPVTHCPPCNGKAVWADPEKRQHALDAIQRRYAEPGARERRAADCRATSLRTWSDPEKRARMVENSRRRASVLSPNCQAAAQTPEAKAKRVRSFLRTKYAWCPEDRYADYRRLVDVKNIKPAEARRMIEEDVARAARRTIEETTGAMHAKAARQKRDAY